jgi:hypothetical protein
MNKAQYDICVVGGGSGGFGAACAAARLGANVLLVEAGPGLGGTRTRSGVNNYEPVAGATGLPQEIYERLREIPDAVTLQRPWAKYHPERPWGWTKPSEQTDYRLSLSRRSGVPIVFEPDTLNRVMQEMLKEAGCSTELQTRFTEVNEDRSKIQSIVVDGPDGSKTIEANLFIDATADINLARAAGCRTAIGVEAHELYNEPSAPEQPELVLNNASLCYRIAPLKAGESTQIQPKPNKVDLEDIHPVTSIRTYPNGDLNMNPLHMMSGVEAYNLGKSAYEEAEKRIYAHWHVLQTRYDFDRWRLVWISPALGVRETHRLIGQYVLQEQDLEDGLEKQRHPDVIAFADHALDFHGSRPSRELTNGPYGIPFRCLLSREMDNLLVACRGASFSSIAASSCRLSRTMMVLGQAAGTAAALFGEQIQQYDAQRLRAHLRQQGVALALSDGYLEAFPSLTPLQTPRW